MNKKQCRAEWQRGYNAGYSAAYRAPAGVCWSCGCTHIHPKPELPKGSPDYVAGFLKGYEVGTM